MKTCLWSLQPHNVESLKPGQDFLFKRTQSEDANWLKMYKNRPFSICRCCTVVPSLHATEVLFCFQLELLRALPFWFTSYQWEAETIWFIRHFCHMCLPCSWTHRHGLSDIKWQRSWAHFHDIQILTFKILDHKWLKNWWETFFPFHSHQQGLWCYFIWGALLTINAFIARWKIKVQDRNKKRKEGFLLSFLLTCGQDLSSCVRSWASADSSTSRCKCQSDVL